MRIRLHLLIMTLLLSACEQKENVVAIRPVKTVLVEAISSSNKHMNFPGTLRAFKRADLSFRIDGMIIMRDIYVGQRIDKDHTLMHLDPREYEIALQRSKGKVVSIEAQLNFAQRDYGRMQAIFEKDPGAISANLVDRKQETVNQLKAELLMAQSELDKATDDLSYTALKAPFDGIVAAIYVENHEQVRAKQVVLRLLDIADREMEINVPEKYMQALLEGKERMQFEVHLDAFPKISFRATIKEIGTEAASNTQTYPVTLSLHQVPMELPLLAGMSGRAFLTQSIVHSSQTFKIPHSAIFAEDGHMTYVWLIDPNTQTVHKKAVKIDELQAKDGVIIQEGLSIGDRVVTAGTHFLREGQKVKFDAGLLQ